MTMTITIIGFDTTSFSGENGNKWFDNTILCIHSKNKACKDKRKPRSKSKKKASISLDKEGEDEDEVTGSFSSSSDPINIPLENNRHIGQIYTKVYFE